ncbi:hypothetical protein BOX15_Mlig012688g11, partial [Macrostomum lignano]
FQLCSATMDKKTKWKKLDPRIKALIENGIRDHHRSMFVIVGDKGRDQVPILHHLLSKAVVKARPSVLWCYKKELGFSTHRKKLMRQLQKKQKSGKLDVNEDNPFELFVCATEIRWCYYSETHKILGNTFGACVLQDFEALTPNTLARTIETVEGGGLVVLLLHSMDSLRQLATMSMDVHARYRTESHQDVVGRFNERFLLSLANCRRCLVLDDKFNVLPLSESTLATIKPTSTVANLDGLSASGRQLKELQESMLTDPESDQRFARLVGLCRTLDQARTLLAFLDLLSDYNKSNATAQQQQQMRVAALTASRGRGKSAALGLAIAAAVGKGVANVCVTSPGPENIATLMQFAVKGLQAMGWEQHTDFTIVESSDPDSAKCIVKICLRVQQHRYTIAYLAPSANSKPDSAELLCIDEAAAIPLATVRAMMGSNLCFLSSTVNGYEGTGRSLSLKLISQLRQDASSQLKEITLDESIRYGPGDPIESWLNDLLCLDCSSVPMLHSGCPSPSQCQLYYVNRDTLFAYHKFTENFLHRLMSLYVSSHYRNSPNDLQMLSDAPAHHIFVLLGPFDKQAGPNQLPEILSVLQVCLEGAINRDSVHRALAQGRRPAGDLVPWTVSQQFSDADFPSLSGARVVRVATHPDYQRMGYGSRALQLLADYYEGKFPFLAEESAAEKEEAVSASRAVTADQSDDGDQDEGGFLSSETLVPKSRSQLPPLLSALTERRPEPLHYLAVSFGLTHDLTRFWKRAGFAPLYLRQTPNAITGEHSAVLLRHLATNDAPHPDWLLDYFVDFRRRLIYLLAGDSLRRLPVAFALELVRHRQLQARRPPVLNSARVEQSFSAYDLRRLSDYAAAQADHYLITDLLCPLARLYFAGDLGEMGGLTVTQQAILLGCGLQMKSADSVAADLSMPVSQVLGLFNRIIRKAERTLRELQEAGVAERLLPDLRPSEAPLVGSGQQQPSLADELNTGAAEVEAEHRRRLQELLLADGGAEEFAIPADAAPGSALPTLNRVNSAKSKQQQQQQQPGGKKRGGGHGGGGKKKKPKFK